jgi:TnpA family transposase
MTADVDLAQARGGGLVAAVDGIRFVVPVRGIHARPNPQYFGHRRGVTWLTLHRSRALIAEGLQEFGSEVGGLGDAADVAAG